MGTYIPTLRAYESQLLEEFFSVIKARKTPIIAIGGFSGTGKDTVALFIQEYFKKFHNINLKITLIINFFLRHSPDSEPVYFLSLSKISQGTQVTLKYSCIV